jgi:hypothetical protein
VLRKEPQRQMLLSYQHLNLTPLHEGAKEHAGVLVISVLSSAGEMR